jgi:hypothetical protein
MIGSWAKFATGAWRTINSRAEGKQENPVT